MRFHLPATASLCCLMPLGLGMGMGSAWAAPPAVQPGAPAAAAPAATSPTADGFAALAAARHAKRTACQKEARTKKLVGAAKNAYIKDCLAGT